MFKSAIQFVLTAALLLGSAASFFSSEVNAANKPLKSFLGLTVQQIISSNDSHSLLKQSQTQSKDTLKVHVEDSYQWSQDDLIPPISTLLSNQAFYFRANSQVKPFYFLHSSLDPPYTNKIFFFELPQQKASLPSYTLKGASQISRIANWKDSNLLYTGCITYS